MSNEQTHILALASILQGLLATGRYTENDGFGAPGLTSIDHGISWKKEGYKKRFESVVMRDAQDLLDEALDHVAFLAEIEKKNPLQNEQPNRIH